MKLGKGIYVYQVYLDKRFPEEAELIKILEPYAKKRRSSAVIVRALIQALLGRKKAETRLAEQADPDLELTEDDIQAIDETEEESGGNLIDRFTDSFSRG